MKTVKVSAADRMRAGSWTVAAVGPVEVEDELRLEDRLSRIAGIGPQSRFGLRPDPATRSWEFRPEALAGCIEAGEPVDPELLPSVVAEMARTQHISKPVRAVLVGDHVLTGMSHGLGDGNLFLRLNEALTGGGQPSAVSGWDTAYPTRSPLRAAILNHYGRNPRAIRELASGRGASARDGGAGGTQRPWTPSPCIAFARASASVQGELRAWRTRRAPDASVSAMMFAALSLAVRIVGIEVSNTAHVVFDCRRYLPDGELTQANFATGLDLHLDDIGSPEAFQRAIAGAAASGRPLANLTVSSLRTLLGRTPGRVDSRSGVPTAQLAFSDMGQHPVFDSMKWLAEPEDRRFIAASDTAGPEGMTFAMGRIGKVYHVTASFHDNVFDAAAVQQALDLATTAPAEILEARR